MSTKIEWTDATWNPVIGCTKVSPGCANCYALPMARRLAGSAKNHPGSPTMQAYTRVVEDGRWCGATTIPSALEQPLRWRKPRMVFVCSMGDLFHESVPFEFIAAVFGVMAATPQHTFQVLTKRPEMMLEFLRWIEDDWRPNPAAQCMQYAIDAWPSREPDVLVDAEAPWPLPNVWLGVTTEDQQRADERIPLLLRCPAAVRFVSVEPMLGAVDLTEVGMGAVRFDALLGLGPRNIIPRPTKPSLDWVIVGGESGPGARPMHPDWARSLRDQCQAAGVSYFFKQWGAWAHHSQWEQMKDTDKRLIDYAAELRDASAWLRVGKKAAGRILDGRTWDEMPGRAS